MTAVVLIALLGLLRSPAPASAATPDAPGRGILPDNRAWEMVSPPDKNGGDVLPVAERVQVAPDGDAVRFASVVAFADAAGTAVDSDFIARRTGATGTPGWETHSIMPALNPLNLTEGVPLSVRPRHLGALSTDLDAGVFFAGSALPPHENAAGADSDVAADPNLYQRAGLATHAGQSTLVTPCPACNSPLPANPVGSRPELAAISENAGDVLFQSKLNLTTAPGGTPLPTGTQFPKLYKWSAEAGIAFVGVLPDGTPATCNASNACAGAGPGADNFPLNDPEAFADRTLTRDGSRAVFTSPVTTAGRPTSSSGIYIHDDGGTPTSADDFTVKVNASERQVADTAKNAWYWGASTGVDSDGNRAPLEVLFTTTEALTDDSAPNGQVKLYRYSTQPDASGDNLTLLAEPGGSDASQGAFQVGGRVVGVSDDGDRVYFYAIGQLDPDGVHACTSTTPCLFLWENQGSHASITEIAQEDPANPLASQPNLPRHRVTPDGRYLAFMSDESADLPGANRTIGGEECEKQISLGGLSGIGNTDICGHVYLFDAEDDDGEPLVCASCPQSHSTGEAGFHLSLPRGGTQPVARVTSPLTADGRRLFFSTPERLAAEDRNDSIDVYQYETQTGRVSLLSSGRDGAAPAYFLDASPSGDDVLILTRERLSAWDVDTSFDIYDARVNGGFAEPVADEIPCLESVGCRGPAPGAPVGDEPGTTAETEGNLLAADPGCSAAEQELAKAKKKAKRLKRKAKRAHGKKAKRLKKKAKKAKKKVKSAKQALRDCERGES